ncbi:hypothetical protein VAE151_620023 [Vibrio aestuarianus]|uniref:Uncharacterized protein n=1 Tax=Vibrio aestuarianus TaxID=28171 RepID=A0ABM9FUF6_9VIBR|nr:hypothetical protein VAE308_1120023 [Vibrio aestuarianus]CAH8216685.1 hypothetical protein VIBAE_B10035 [Vibrio aestuarianus subsp. francensis]CAH8217882.1 hypothetical protein VAE055_410035 [Vibrio aestuarianus]CAH8218064.1 hypothetical protein VAE032_310036 [Vibrio aestuarianus]CAH8218185.1 hypothetical protein VAE128_490036 [Vibrio aestuarianus]
MKTINLRLFKNPFRLSQPAENTERILNEIVELTLKTHQTHNAALRGAGTQYKNYCKAP